MTRIVLSSVAGLVLAIGLAGCGSGDPEIPEGYDQSDIRSAEDAPDVQAPGTGLEGPTKSTGPGG